ncbi:MAG: hypothetical protein RIF34_07790, partial [Candidatus Kapaibacterium sp.]
MDKNTFSLQVGDGLVVKGDIYSSAATSQPILIITHGFKAYRKWGFFPYMAEQYSKAGLIVINIDFSQNAVVDAEKGIFDANIFRTVTVSQEIKDLHSVIDNLNNLIEENSIKGWNGEVFLLGHSLGGAVSIITASQRKDISKIVTWGSIG